MDDGIELLSERLVKLECQERLVLNREDELIEDGTSQLAARSPSYLSRESRFVRADRKVGV